MEQSKLSNESQYQSYLLRLWRDVGAETWRLMLEHVGTHERYGFADLVGLCAFLQKQMKDEIMLAGERDENVRVCYREIRVYPRHRWQAIDVFEEVIVE